MARPSTLGEALAAARRLVSEQERPCKVEVLVAGALLGGLSVDLDALVDDAMVSRRLTITWGTASGRLQHRTWARVGGRVVEDQLMRDIHPEQARRIELWRLQQFDLERIEGTELILAFRGRARSNPRDERIFVFAEVRELADGTGTELDQWGFERAYYEAVRVLRDAQSRQSARRRFHGNRMVFCIQPVLTLTAAEVSRVAQRLEPASRGLGVQKAIVQTRLKEGDTVRPTEFVVRMHGQHRLEVEERPPSPHPIRAMTPYDMRVVRAQRLGYTYPYEMVWMLQGRPGTVEGQGWPIPRGYFQEYDLDDTGQVLMPVERPYGSNTSGVVVGLMTHYTDAYPEGMARVWIASDSTKAMGALAEPECRRVVAALNMAEERELPVEWLPISAGARIAMDSGTENLDWTARVLRRIVEFTQGGGEINLIVAGVNVGAQSYWNAEATMLMHTRGVLIMTPEGSMVLTGKKALEYSGGVAAEDERGIGGFERIMGPNGQAQYFARDLGEAYRILFAHYRYTYRKSGEPGPRLHPTEDPRDRSVLMAPYRPVGDETFTTVGAIFDEESNPGRKKPFAIREVMAAVIDQDGTYLERFKNMRHAEMAQVWDASVGGHAVCMVGFESRPIPRVGRIPMDGPDTWTGGTLFPQSSRKVARALNGASGNRPVVVLANLSGFDGSPESLRKLQLEYGAEIGRAVVNFQGPIIFVVIGRYHGGSYVVFSKALNPNLTALALEGSFASV
ncbi:MAG: carboxyl transferase domain-containing protein, partial [Myxococcota bacterium]